MTTQNFDQVLDVIEGRLDGLLDSEWVKAPWIGALFTDDFEGMPTPIAHRAYAVELTGAVWPDKVQGGPQGRAPGAMLTISQGTVHWAFGFELDDPAAQHRAALQAERLLIEAIRKPSGVPVKVYPTSSRRQADPNGWLFGQIFFNAKHHLAAG